MIYVSHPYSGDVKNKHKVERIIRKLVIDEPNEIFISPVHAFGFMYNDVDYDKGMDMCLALLSKCHKMYVFGSWTQSKGCQREILFAENLKMQVQIRENQ